MVNTKSLPESNAADVPPRTFTTPMMQQYMALKTAYPDHLLLYRLGDFYELFLDDAEIAARVLQIVLTRRPRGKDGDIPMAGVPYHAVDRYMSKLIQAGYKIAVCEQVSDPKEKGLVQRAVVRIITPGTVLDEKSLSQKEHNYIMSLVTQRIAGKESLGIAVADLSTGSFQITSLSCTEDERSSVLARELQRFHPSEILVNDHDYNDQEFLHGISSHTSTNITRLTDWDTYTHRAEDKLKAHFHVSDLRGFGFEVQTSKALSSKGLSPTLQAAAALLSYLKYTQRSEVEHIRSIHVYQPDDTVALDASTMSNLELFTTLHENAYDGSLLSVIDQTQSAMGGRLLREWMRRPLRDKKALEERLDCVEYFVQNRLIREAVRDILMHIYDIERLVSRLSVGIGNAADLVNLASSLEYAHVLHTKLSNEHAQVLKPALELFLKDGNIDSVISLIRSRIVEDPPIDVRSGRLIQKGFHKELDDLRDLASGGKEWLIHLEETERKRTGFSSLKVRFNKVFGYYIEISKALAAKVPEEYMRKQTLVNAERFTTPELKEYEEKILTAEEKIFELEYELFKETVTKALAHTGAIQSTSHGLAQLDCLSNFAEVADTGHYCRPTLNTSGTIKIDNGRHPVVEKLLTRTQFVPNSVMLDHENHQLHIITGPNMAGKSVFIRQVALITLLAHIGSFVPAQQASLSIVDRIFVRSGASDMITSGLSTFMVEMVETAYILNHATSKSLIILDEIGRGTSTYDGISIAWAVADYLVTHWKKGPMTLFATHYHELQDLEHTHPEYIKNYHMAVEDHKGVPIFLHRVVEGGASHSYGIAVARLAGVPDEVIQKARERLLKLEV